ncbi:MAG: Gfo/Idh/MocA family oxidoreductase [Cyclobacteriaceae bacterium]
MKFKRRDFIKKTVAGTAALSFGGILPGFSAKSYDNIVGANERVQIGMMGVNSRGLQLAKNFAKESNCEIIYVSDVDTRATAKCIGALGDLQKKLPKAAPDFRKALDDKELDALVIAAPDHWHAPAAILASKAGKHVYLEKPCSHNPHEGELLVKAAAKYKTVIQMGNQRRSFPNIISAINELHAGVIGRVYFAKTWYDDARPSIGRGKEVAVPDWLDYELWQGPAPRKPYKDNVVHYKWHWFWHWGTGESLNNGTHFVDLARWGLGVEYPVLVNSSGGRYHYQDDQETPDTQVITMDFANNTSMVWEGRSCNLYPTEGTSVGVIFFGDNGTLSIQENAYKIFDKEGKLVKEVNDKKTIEVKAGDRMNPSPGGDMLHIQNFIEGIKNGTKLNADISGGHQSTLLVQLGNIALRSKTTLHIDPTNGHIKDKEVASKYWSREYEPGWEPEI